MAPSKPILALENAALRFGARQLFEALSFGIDKSDRLCLVGRNGSGKSSLLKVLAGAQDLDAGRRYAEPGLRVASLPQDPVFPPEQRAADFVAAGPRGEEAPRHRVDAVLKRLRIEPDRLLAGLSGGEGRRLALARTLVEEADVLLLDEPTNHLDLPSIEWLEDELARLRGALLVISHDRAFLQRVSRATLWLDRGIMRRMDKPFAGFEDWVEEVLAREAEAFHKLKRRIVREEHWLRRGVTARRKRNQGRLARLHDLRKKRAEWLHPTGKAAVDIAKAESSGARVIEAHGIGKSYRASDGGERIVVRDFSTRIRRGDRIGVIGPNGAGKTTLIRMLTGALTPDSGRIEIGLKVECRYFDQKRESLDPEATLWNVMVPGGGDTLLVGGRQRHAVSYLRDFLFDEDQARQPVKSLSGGEKNRLLLARLFARPGNLLVLDEPTNDLDLETLDLLLEVLDGYQGTLLLVSHDRDFLDRLVTSTIAVEGGGEVREYVGGHADYRRQRAPRAESTAAPAQARKTKPKEQASRPRGKLGYKDARELDGLPAEIERLTAARDRLQGLLGDADLFARDPAAFQNTTRELATVAAALEAAEARWLELEEQREALAAGGSPS